MDQRVINNLRALVRQFDDVDQGRIEQVRQWDQALTTVRAQATPLELPLAGDMVFLDEESDGYVYVRFNDKDGARFLLKKGGGIEGPLFARVFLDWPAQAGKNAYINYGLGVRFKGTSEVNVAAITDPLTPDTLVAQYFRASVSAALFTVVLPATNVNGVKVFRCGFAADAGLGRIMAKASAPTSITDTAANTLLLTVCGPTIANNSDRPVIVPAGLGIYEQHSNGATTSRAYVEYEVL